MRNFELIRFSNTDELAHAVAEEWLKRVAACQGNSLPRFVALSGGRVAQRFFDAVAEGWRRGSLALDAVEFFWADERAVPPEHEESNFGLANRYLFQPLGIPRACLHRVRGDLPPARAASDATLEIRRFVPCNEHGQPVLDIVLLGMGEDGHVASLFTSNLEHSSEDQPVYIAVVGPKPPPDRITLSYAAIAAAQEVWVLASGQGKKQALEAALAGEGKTPLARVLQSRRGTRIFTDIPIVSAT